VGLTKENAMSAVFIRPKPPELVEIDHDKKIEWMALYAVRNQLQLTLEGECGFGRECVGVLSGDQYPSYRWYDSQTYKQLDNNGEIWRPTDAYHKHDCVAVLGRGEKAEAQLYQWLRWFEENGFKVETGTQPVDPKLGVLPYIMGNHRYARMVKSV
jgi:hypothetical protein